MKLRLIKMKCVQSTNKVAIKILKKNPKPTLITALVQKNGRGTMGKKWISQRGNLFISIFFKMNFEITFFNKYAFKTAY